MNEMTRWRGQAQALGEPLRDLPTETQPFHRPDVVTVVRAIISNLRLIALITLLGAVAAYVVLRAMPQQFTATALIMLDSRNTLLEETQGVFAGMPIADTYIESEIELLRSDAIVHEVIKQEKLLEDPEFTTDTIPAGIRRIINARADGASEGNSEDLLQSVKLFQVSKEVRRRLTVQRRGLSQGIEVSFRSKSQEKARDLANTFAESYVDDQLNSKLTASNRAMDWLRSELQSLSRETQIAEAKVEEYRAKNTLVGEGEQGVGAQQLRLLTEKLTAAQAEEAEAKVKVEQLRRLKASGGSLLTIPEVGENKQIEMLRQQLSEAEQAEAEMANLYNSEKRDIIPPYQEAYARRKSLEAGLGREIARVEMEIEARLASASAVTQSLAQELQQLRGKNAEVNEASIGLNDLEREANGKRARYDSLLAEFNETNNTAAAQTPHARIVSPAELPLTPSAPRKKAAFAAVVIFSAAFGVFLALLREFSRRSIRTPEELFSTLNMRPVGVVPRLSGSLGKRRKDLIATMGILTKAPQSDYAEAIRRFRAELFLTTASGCDNVGVITITSPDSVKGKTGMAGSLARSLCLAGTKVLLVDADLRQAEVLPRLYKNYDGPDLANVLRGQTEWRDAVIIARNRRLSFLAARPGGWDEAVSQAFSGRFQDLVAAWREEYQAVIINAPPVCGFPEARAIGACADKVILALEWNATQVQTSIDAIGLLRETSGPPLIAITNVAKSHYRRWLRIGSARYASGRSQLSVVPVN